MTGLTSDELTKPLGQDGPARRPPRRLPLARIGAGFLGLVVLALGAYVALVDDPLGGEPYAIAAITPRTSPAPAAAPPPTSGARVQDVGGDPERRSASEVESASGVAVVRPDGHAAPGSVVIRVPDAPGVTKLRPAPDPRLVEKSRHGLLPRRSPEGLRPAEHYARPPGALPGGARPQGRVALLVGGLGISPTTTAEAIERLPPAVTLAFAPYGAELDRLAAKAREGGHETMLQVPMEPFDYPDNDPGPQTLTARAKPAENLERLHWALGRFAGYVGVVNFMGAKLTADEAALTPILKEVGSRGLVFLDDGSSSRSIVAPLGQAAAVPTLRADLVLDAVPRAEAIDRELERLEALARERGLAVGTANALPLTLDRLARWTKTLEAKGLLLVPVSAAFAGTSAGAPR